MKDIVPNPKHFFDSTKCFRANSNTTQRNGKRKASKRRRTQSKRLLKDEQNGHS